MNILENIRNALGAIGSNKMRSALTMLGVIIGVASVVLMVAIGQGAQKSVTSRIESLGTNLLAISPGSPTQTNVRFGGGSSTLPEEDIAAIREYVQGLSGIAPELRGRSQVIVGNLNVSTTVVGTTADYTTVRNAAVAYGSFLTEDDVAQFNKVAVLGPTVVQSLFPDTPNPLGSDIRIGNNIFTVIGVLESKGQQGFNDQDDMIVIPLSTMQQRITGRDVVSSIYVSVADQTAMEKTQMTITAVLLNAHGITDVSKQDFTVLNQADAVETLNEVTSTFTLLLGGIAAISLLVGGIGVMNIMLVSVTERTREIGIRKAIGAKKRDILLQFLVESTVLSVLGGIVGTLLSAGGAWIVRANFSLDATVAPSSVLLAFAFSVAVGIFFGMLPAWKAAKLRPIEALRYE
ncbi:MAG TPA: multidrug ABC transporter substrate-binding protein [Candidatus Peribacter riflensis]|uniref:Antimicrobial peptide ABC transporter permease n=1 Tax=Candidatus Peribacter riflensis TaxID=1735162 RepID=A0A0S1SM43_9BACT|nr:MAG: antimicrobial peptide ABC transporter permease [Candidatus Peribacter riflensis]OGJ77927.1 MAG: multidrug ABC transporter substrate-binding protein [Candidatus Peribacteria bacterium RIFOXYB1_FULL_57_12]OGJ79754.1 MAG: multidrug ABC transporter substrate-binding protein [Candidatus Peribacteria bacterium RIFOXYC1_FULL_58_8]ALM11560.1 MAG: antimicrobial peptide ABC transporter permease [Candidatus Peribacter riflensis]ALM12662.1 MAG: antimicrobial peptide ABC transporter permease [Candid